MLPVVEGKDSSCAHAEMIASVAFANVASSRKLPMELWLQESGNIPARYERGYFYGLGL